MDKIVKIGNTHEGRDKSLKLIQYLFKLHMASSGKKEVIDALSPAFSKIFYTN